MKRQWMKAACALALLATGVAHAEVGDYLDNAEVGRVVQKAKAQIAEQHLTGCVAVVDASAALLFVERLDNAPPGCVDAAIGKARTSALYRVPSLKLMQRLAGGETTVLAIPHAVPLGGGYPITVNGKVVGAVGVSTPKQALDNSAAEAAAGELH